MQGERNPSTSSYREEILTHYNVEAIEGNTVLNHISLCNGHHQGMTSNKIQHGEKIQNRDKMSCQLDG